MISATATECRQHNQVRDIFAQACDLLAPIIAENARIKTLSNFAMSHMLKVRFPELSATEIHIVLVTVEKLHPAERLAK
jgi:hypothetical protein